MSKVELSSLIAIGFFVFEIVFIRIGFFVGSSITNYTLLFSFLIYSATLVLLFSFVRISGAQMVDRFIALFGFMLCVVVFAGVAVVFSDTYDISWDGQGYHQTAVIALANGWNPMRDSSITFKQYLPSQIFAEGYPSALWEIEGSIYAITKRINSAKVVNIAIATIAGALVYSMLRKVSFGKILAFFTSLFIVLQPVYTLQFLTFMQDGFGYELLLIAVASLVIIIISPKSYWAIAVLLFTELLLVSTKYSHLPVALVLGIIFMLVAINNFLNREYFFDKATKIFLCGFIFISLIFAYLPYIRNQIAHGSFFYPINIPDLSGAVTYNNIPNNLQESNKVKLLFYGIFSKSQSAESGAPESLANIAELKIPFTFSKEEIEGVGILFNNRVGAGGPLFSGIVILSVGFLIVMSFRTTNIKERYAIYTSYFCLASILLLSLLAPTPNLLRYVNQLQLIPFAVVIPIYAVFRRSYVTMFTIVVVTLVGINTTLYSYGVIQKNIVGTEEINKQFADMRDSKSTYQVRAQQFYSSYVLFNEQNIPIVITDKLQCDNVQDLAASSTTTQFCVRQP